MNYIICTKSNIKRAGYIIAVLTLILMQMVGTNYKISLESNNETPNSQYISENYPFKSPSQWGYIQDWLIGGPFKAKTDEWEEFPTYLTGKDYINTSLYYTHGDPCIPEDEPLQGSNNESLWYEYSTDRTYVDLDELLEPDNYRTVYALTYVYFPTDIDDIIIDVGGDDGIKVIFDGEEIYYDHELWWQNEYIDIGTVSAGWHTAYVMVENMRDWWGFAFRFLQNITEYDYLDVIPGLGISLDWKSEFQQYEDVESLFLFDTPLSSQHIANFTLLNGTITSGPWNTIDGFLGKINTFNIPFLRHLYPEIEILDNSILETKMNNLQQQIQTYPGVINTTNGYGLTGNSNSSIGFIDSGIDLSHIAFNNSYGDLDFNEKIIGWEDFSENYSIPEDPNGHGTSLAAISTGFGSNLLSPNQSGGNYYVSMGGYYSHFDLFSPNHLIPRTYQIKLGSLNISNIGFNIDIQGNFKELTGTSQINNIKLVLTQDGNIRNSTAISGDSSSLDYHTTGGTIGLYEIWLEYNILIGAVPEFQININTQLDTTETPSPFADFTGIAPNTQVVSLKILNNLGLGTVSDLFSALEWVVENGTNYHMVSTLLSLGFTQQGIPERILIELNELIDIIIDSGIMVIIAAGNDGMGINHLNLLGSNPRTIVVGAVNDQDQLTSYTSQGKEFTNNGLSYIKPDLVAPGGSNVPTHSMVTTAESNSGDFSQLDVTNNDLTSISGTSVAAAVVAGVFSLIVERVGGWENWSTSPLEKALYAKMLLLLTATETNLPIEDNPYSSFDESSLSAPLTHSVPDPYEGYGRINSRAIFDLLNNSFTINSSIQTWLSASDVDAYGNHIYATNITLTEDRVHLFNLTSTGDLDADLALYSTKPDEYGQPVLIKESTYDGSSNELFYYTNIHPDETYYLIVKAISGEGMINLEVSQPVITIPPQVDNGYYEILGDYTYNDSLDTYRFYVNYSHPDNYEPSAVFFMTNDSLSPVIMEKVDLEDNNYIDGCLYQLDYKFTSNTDNGGNFEYYFTAQLDLLFTNHTDTGELPFIIQIEPIPNLHIGSYYESDFKTISDGSEWNFQNEDIEINFQNSDINVTGGWNWIEVSNENEDRRTVEDDDSWGGLYFGISGLSSNPNTPLIVENTPVYSYEGLSGQYEMYSPHIYLNSSESLYPLLRLGLRLSVDPGDEFIIQLNSNRTGWTDLESFSDIQGEWSLLQYNLSAYVDSYIQFRYSFTVNNMPMTYTKGVLIDYMEIETANIINWWEPILEEPDSIHSNHSVSSLTTPGQADAYKFQIAYKDVDNNYPIEAYLQIEDNYFLMNNEYGRWNSNSMDSDESIILSVILNVIGFSNTSYRFHVYDGYYWNATEWFPAIKFQEYNINNTLTLPLNRTYTNADVKYWSNFLPHSMSIWNTRSESWHQVASYGETINPEEWYCGVGSYLGYEDDWDESLILPAITLNGTFEVFLNFSSQLTFNFLSQNDYAEVLISDNNGKNWNSITRLTEQTFGFESHTLDLTQYINQTVIIRFRFVSDAEGIRSGGSGWRIRDIGIDINRTKDYYGPNIEFFGILDGQSVHGLVDFSAIIMDNIDGPISNSSVEFYINTKFVNITEFYNETTGYLNYTLDARKFDDGDKIQLYIRAIDSSGNYAIKKIRLTVSIPYENYTLGIVIGAAMLFGLALLVRAGRKHKIRKLMAKGDYVPQPNIRDRISQNKFLKEEHKAESELVINAVDEEWEEKQPFTLNCKSCHRWYSSSEYEIYCPQCKKPALRIAKYCPVCKKWQYFDDEVETTCKRCKLPLLKDFDKARHHIIEEREKIVTLEAAPHSENYKKFEEMAENFSPQEIVTVINNAKKGKLKMITELAEQLTAEELDLLEKKLNKKTDTIHGGTD